MSREPDTSFVETVELCQKVLAEECSGMFTILAVPVQHHLVLSSGFINGDVSLETTVLIHLCLALVCLPRP